MKIQRSHSGLALVAFIALVFVACSSSRPAATQQTGTSPVTTNNSDNDGSSFKKAIVIEERNSSKGVAAEYAWIRENYPGSKMKQQSLVRENGKPYDVLTIVTADGMEKTIHFEISNFFGK
jgi:hypothetical protein